MLKKTNSEERLQKINEFLIQTVEKKSNLKIFEDTVSEETLEDIRKETNGWNYFIYETSGFSKSEDKKFMIQTVLLRFYSENRDDLDQFSLELISALDGRLLKFEKSLKGAIKKGKEDSYIDEIEFYFTRMFENEC
ncbi:hypothetical protein [Enterococcus spodopteracolus]|uniref:hypothetical protein n=1 Tax=Enterococcus spodopteracolus TaxID=3034501 RepID=UPI00264A203F|nr:hypothetical protein [Enterococcus spodopteracolus]